MTLPVTSIEMISLTRMFPVKGLRGESEGRSVSGGRGRRRALIFTRIRTVGALVAVFATLFVAAPHSLAQIPGKQTASVRPAAIKSFRLVQEKDGPAVEILSTRPLVPSIQSVDNPPRLVIDLPNAILDTPQKQISIDADQISALRADQFQANPPVARIVVDLVAPRTYTWDAAGNRLLVHLGKSPSPPKPVPLQQPTVVGLGPSAAPAVAGVRASGPMAITQNSLRPGAAVTAGRETAVLALSRGGEVYVCPGTAVSVTPSQNGHNVLLGMNRGALETHFTLDASSDSILTPDFRILFPGPGDFHYAVSADSQGNTCVRALAGNTASVIVSELIGDRTYQVKATDRLVFRGGRLDQVDTLIPRECGCPPPPQPLPVEVVKQGPATSDTETSARPAGEAEPSSHGGTPAPVPEVPNSDASANEVHVQVTEPLVFRATAPPAPVDEVGQLPADSRLANAPALSAALPPPDPRQQALAAKTASGTAPSRRGFFGKLRGFFASIFR